MKPHIIMQVSSATMIFIIFWDFLMFTKFSFYHKIYYYWCAIIIYKHGIYEFPDELPNDLGS